MRSDVAQHAAQAVEIHVLDLPSRCHSLRIHQITKVPATTVTNTQIHLIAQLIAHVA